MNALHNNNPVPVDDWLMAEAVRLHEERDGRHRDDAPAVAIARNAEGDQSRRIAARAGALPDAVAMRTDIAHLRRLMRRTALGFIAVGVAAGALAARASIAERQVDILLAAAALLVVPTLMLLVWLLLMGLSRRGSGSGSLAGGTLVALLRWLGPKLLTSPRAADITLAGGGLMRTAFGRWLLSALAHGFWLAYAAAALATLALYFSIVQYDLTWGTTLLRDDTVIWLVEVLARAPAALGLIADPDPGWIIAGREGSLADAGRAAWARFLLAMIFVYGLLPRLLLAAVSLGLAWLAARRLKLDTGLPGYLRLASVLAPVNGRERVSGPPPPAATSRRRRRRRRNAGPPVLVAIELEREAHPQPLWIPGVELRVLGRIDDRAGRQAALAALADPGRPPAAVVAVCSMLRTPDAGTQRLLNCLADAADAPLVLVLDEGGEFERRGGAVASRLADWEELAERVGADAVLLDLAQPDAAAIARVHQSIHGTDESA